MMNYFCSNAASLSEPPGVTAFDKRSIGCETIATTESYMKSKPVRFEVRLYASCGSHPPYLCRFADNGSHSKTSDYAPV